MQTRSVALAEAALVGYVIILGLVAFARFIGLIVNDDWLVPLVLMMGIQFVSGLLLSQSRGQLSWPVVTSELTIKCLLLLAVGSGFAVQRMGDDSAAWAWGHYTLGAAIGFEFMRFMRVLQAFGVKLGPLDLMATWFEKTFIGEFRKAEIREAKVDAALSERKAAKQEFAATGEVRSSAAINTISGEMPAVKPWEDEGDPAPSGSE